ncbi:Aldedh domain-containing protein [Mycena sanguinolenta]|uniref:Aldedh domain-containing protein n=1 Tax=Mycena sanguinolenta TaxID=230812 RepID=A0A8H6YF63_9AGAR|nr:Aldedh domain-containing protein [Mycena sanguinolenta]
MLARSSAAWGDRIGPHERIWLMLTTLVNVLLIMTAALVIWSSGQSSVAAMRGDPSWTNALTFVVLAFRSASLGVQGIVGKRLNTQFTSTIILTTIWLIAAACGAGRTLATRIGAAGALAVGAGIRALITLAWIVVPGKPVAS